MSKKAVICPFDSDNNTWYGKHTLETIIKKHDNYREIVLLVGRLSIDDYEDLEDEYDNVKLCRQPDDGNSMLTKLAEYAKLGYKCICAEGCLVYLDMVCGDDYKYEIIE